MQEHIESNDQLWSTFAKKESLTPHQVNQFKRYAELLVQTNEQFNLTAIVSLKRILAEHFSDSLVLSKFVDFKSIKVIADVGAGAGFPALPLKILFPHLGVILLEVSSKKRNFLQMMVEQLELTDVNICSLDWRSFLRSTQGEVDLFVSRASLADEELARLFRHNCHYRNAQLVYWASEEWEVHPKAAQYIAKVDEYSIGSKKRKLVFMKAPK